MTMKTIGLIGGMTWHSSAEYYRLINEDVQKRLGGAASARCVMYSLEFQEVEDLQEAGDWKRLTDLMTDAALRIEAAGADFIVICANTMHKTAEAIERATPLPLVHIVDAAAGAIRRQKLKTVGLLGTRYTMEQDFYRARLEKKHGLQVLVPDEAGRTTVHDVIYKELSRGLIREDSRLAYQEVIGKLQARGAEGIILGCTEIPLLIKAGDAPLPVFDTTALHAKAAVDLALSD
jgi:aspartate racemase